MEVVVAKSAGFCFGVKRAVDSVYELFISNNDNMPSLCRMPIDQTMNMADKRTSCIDALKPSFVYKLIRFARNSMSVTVIETKEQAENFQAKKEEKLYIVSQTTFNYKKFKDLVEIFRKKGYDIIVANTICNLNYFVWGRSPRCDAHQFYRIR